MKRMTPPALLAVSLLAVFSGAFVTSPVVCGSERHGFHAFVLPVPEAAASKSMLAMVEKAAQVITDKVGVRLVIETVTYAPGDNPLNIVVRYFAEGKADFGFVPSQEYVEYVDAGGGLLEPFMTFTILKKKYTNVCMYVRKRDAPSSLKELRGFRWGGSTLLPTLRILYEHKIKEQMDGFFSKVEFLPESDFQEFITALVENRVDVVTAHEYAMRNQIPLHKRGKEITPLLCAEHDHNWIFVKRATVPEDLVARVKKIFYKAHTDADFEQFRFVFYAIEGQFVDFVPDGLEHTRYIVNIQKKMGWHGLEREFLKGRGKTTGKE
ncbi:MAG: PhnD/SsuA/transferrin family substrate-binding protein [bacterium]